MGCILAPLRGYRLSARLKRLLEKSFRDSQRLKALPILR
jgi:hypothetical protein